MPKCPHCGSSGKINRFVYFQTGDEEGFDIDVSGPHPYFTYIVCPDCDAILGGSNKESLP